MALLDHIGWEPTSTRTRFPISMPAERLQQVIRPLLEYTRDAVASPENTAPRLAEAVLENLDRQATAQILATSDAGDLARSRRPIITVACYHDVMPKNLTVRLDSELAADAEAIARADGTSLNETIKQALSEAVQRRRRDPKFKARLRRIIEEDRELLERLAK